MNENEPETTSAETSSADRDATPTVVRKKPIVAYIIAGLVVVAIVLVVLYQLEKEGRSSTTVFESLIEQQQANTVVAIVNGEDIKNAALETSLRQFAQAAAAQGVDTTSAEAQTELRTQALNVLVNTTLLKQAATEQGITVTAEEVDSQLETIRTSIGGEAALAERMAALSIKADQLRLDIEDELMIQKLLDTVFASADLSVSEEEIAAVYESAGGAEAGLPALEEVRGQVEAQIRASKEQEVIDEYLSGLKDTAEIELL